MDHITYRDPEFRPVAVPGWRVLSIDPNGTLHTRPLAGWISCQEVVNGRTTDRQETFAAYCRDDGTIVRVDRHEDPDFWRVLGPDEPDPADDEVRALVASRGTHAA